MWSPIDRLESTHTPRLRIKESILDTIVLGDPGAVSRVDKMSMVNVYWKIETSPRALTLTEPVPEAFELPASDWPEKFFLVSYTT